MQVPSEKDRIEHLKKFLLEKSGLSEAIDFSTLTQLNLPNCNLSSLPSELPELVPNLSILFCPNNRFEELPDVVGQCPNLQMVSFKENGMKGIHRDALQPQLRWLILTGNSIETIPETIGRCTKLQKLMLSGNSLKVLPDSIQHLTNLELIRLACNDLQEVSPVQHPRHRLVQQANIIVNFLILFIPYISLLYNCYGFRTYDG